MSSSTDAALLRRCRRKRDAFVGGMRILPATLFLFALACAPAAAAPVADLRADADRDGALTAADDPLEADGRVLFLANLDDDSGRCAGPLAALVKAGFDRGEPDKCHDAADTVVNGPEDAKDLAPLHVAAWRDAPEGATATVAVAGSVRLLRNGAAYDGAVLSTADLRAGLTFGIEGLDVVRDRAVWDGSATFTLTVTEGGERAIDVVTARVAPVLFPSAAQPATTLYARRGPTEAEVRDSVAETKAVWKRLQRRIRTHTAETLRTVPSLKPYRDDPEGLKRLAQRRIDEAERSEREWQTFARGYKKTLQRFAPVVDHFGGVFAQDSFETGIAAIPGQTMRVSVLAPGLLSQRLKGRQAEFEAWPYAQLRGADAAVVAHHAGGAGFDPTGNFEATPPVPGAPHGRLLVGSGADADGPVWQAFLAGQGLQPVTRVDTSKLRVGHVDELLAVIPASTPQGWVLAVADPGGALKRMRGLAKGTKMLRGTIAYGKGGARRDGERTVGQVLDGPIAKRSAALAKQLDALAGSLGAELGVEVVRIPVLYGPGDGGALVAQTGNTVNGIATRDRTFVAAEPHGPLVKGKDVFKTATADALKGKGVRLRWVDTMPFPHVRLGEVHCYTNALRDPGALSAWWRAN